MSLEIKLNKLSEQIMSAVISADSSSEIFVAIDNFKNEILESTMQNAFMEVTESEENIQNLRETIKILEQEVISNKVKLRLLQESITLILPDLK